MSDNSFTFCWKADSATAWQDQVAHGQWYGIDYIAVPRNPIGVTSVDAIDETDGLRVDDIALVPFGGIGGESGDKPMPGPETSVRLARRPPTRLQRLPRPNGMAESQYESDIWQLVVRVRPLPSTSDGRISGFTITYRSGHRTLTARTYDQIRVLGLGSTRC